MILYFVLGNLSDEFIWIGPASWVFLPLCGLVFALFFIDYVEAPTLAIISALFLRSSVLLAFSPTFSVPAFTFKWDILPTLMILILISLRLVASLFYRMVLPDSMVVEYSFNSRLALNFYAFMLIPMFIKFGTAMPEVKIRYLLGASALIFFASISAQELKIIPKLNMSYLGVSLALVPLVFVWDRCVLTSGLSLKLKLIVAVGMGTLILLSSAHFFTIPDSAWLLRYSGELLVSFYILFWGLAFFGVRWLASERPGS